MIKFLDDVLVLVGCGLVVYGVAQWNPTLAWVVAGVFCIAGGIVYGTVKK